MNTPFAYAQAQAERFEQNLFELLRIPSVSTDPAYSADVNRAADWLVAHMNSIGLQAEKITTDNHPLVYAEWLGAGDEAPTVLIYGHYDVQPADIDDGWHTDPFEPVVKDDGFVYCRGATDDKGQLFIHIAAAEALLKSGGSPVNLKFILEGEEESGGESIEEYIEAHAERLRADVCIISDTSMATPTQPVIISALRGIAPMELHVSGPRQDLHSGSFGGSIHNPVLALAQIVSQFHDEQGRVIVPGFYDGVRPLSDADRHKMHANAYTEDQWRSDTGAPQPWGEPGYSLRERIGARPTLEITGIGGGYADAGFKAIVPQKAVAKILCRLVADQDPEQVIQAVSDYVAQITPPTVESEIIRPMSGSRAVQIDTDHPMMQIASAVYEKHWHAAPVFQREGASIPVVSSLQNKVGLPVIMMGFGLDSDGLHGPNEHFSLMMFHRGVQTMIDFHQRLASA